MVAVRKITSIKKGNVSITKKVVIVAVTSDT